jgi:hypothetical protein
MKFVNFFDFPLLEYKRVLRYFAYVIGYDVHLMRM